MFFPIIDKPAQHFGSFSQWTIRDGYDCWVRSAKKAKCHVAKYYHVDGYSCSIPWYSEDGDHGIHLTTKTAEEGKQLVDAILRLFGWI